MENEIFERDYTVRGYEINKKGHLRLLTLFNLFQDVADTHAALLGVGYDACLAKKVGWVGGSYSVQINRFPAWEEHIRMKTWPAGKTLLTGIRDFSLVNDKNEELVTASSQWIMVDLEKGRPVVIKKYFPEFETIFKDLGHKVPNPLKSVQDFNTDDFEKKFFVRYDDIDINNHVNNAVYPVWASESVPYDFRENHDIEKVEVCFKKPARYGDVILVHTKTEGLKTRHKIVDAQDDTKEFSLVEIVWREKEKTV
jgi:medium-chain acyl-[acyl-carrier-protein] hydrolase